jgi:hypothetical protein
MLANGDATAGNVNRLLTGLEARDGRLSPDNRSAETTSH